MADPKKTLKAIMLSIGVEDEKTVDGFLSEIDDEEAERLSEVLMSAKGGQSKNLASGTGGFLAGLRNVVDSRKSLKESDLPENPRKLAPAEKDAAISGFARAQEKSDESFLAGLKLLVEARAAEGMEKFASWPGELSDEDFPRKVSAFKAEQDVRNEEFIKKMRKGLEDQRIDMAALLKKHRSQLGE